MTGCSVWVGRVLALVLLVDVALAARSMITERRTFKKAMERAAEQVQDDFTSTPPTETVCWTYGDTHITPLGLQPRYNYMSLLPYLMVRSPPNPKKEMNFEVHVRMVYGVWGSATTDNDFAIRCGYDIATFFQPRDGQRVIIKMNGKEINVPRAKTEVFPNAPNGQLHYTIEDISENRMWDMYEINCNFENNSPVYASGFNIKISWYRDGNTNAIYGNSFLRVDPRYRWQIDGACGWNVNAEWPGNKNWLVVPEQSLFSVTPAEIAQSARGSANAKEPDNIDKQMALCKDYILKGTGLDVDKMPDALVKNVPGTDKHIKDFQKSCAIDLWYGADHSPEDSKGVICEIIREVNEMTRLKMDKVGENIRNCVKPLTPVSAYADLVNQKFELDRLCTDTPPTEKRAIPQFPDCTQAAAEQEGKARTVQQQKAMEASFKEEGQKIAAKQQKSRAADLDAQHAQLAIAKASEQKEKAEDAAQDAKLKGDATRLTNTKVVVKVNQLPIPLCHSCAPEESSSESSTQAALATLANSLSSLNSPESAAALNTLQSVSSINQLASSISSLPPLEKDTVLQSVGLSSASFQDPQSAAAALSTSLLSPSLSSGSGSLSPSLSSGSGLLSPSLSSNLAAISSSSVLSASLSQPSASSVGAVSAINAAAESQANRIISHAKQEAHRNHDGGRIRVFVDGSKTSSDPITLKPGSQSRGGAKLAPPVPPPPPL